MTITENQIKAIRKIAIATLAFALTTIASSASDLGATATQGAAIALVANALLSVLNSYQNKPVDAKVESGVRALGFSVEDNK